jgi:hypothetical protein
MLRQVYSHHPQAKVISTSNAEVNAPILSINARVGFTVHRRNVDYQITRTTLDRWCLAQLGRQAGAPRNGSTIRSAYPKTG